MAGALLIILTGVLVALGCVLYVVGFVGWAQLVLVFASGTAGGAVVMILEDRTKP